MKTLLLIKTSLFADGGQSGKLAESYAAAWRDAHPDGTVVVRDLGSDPVPHLDGQRFTALITKPEERTPEQRRIADFSDALIAEIRRADVVVFGLPMYNFGVPSTLKAYFDHIARAGVTFRYTDTGSVGLLGGRRVIVFAARGGVYSGAADLQTNFVRTFLGLLGLTDIEFVYAEGLAMGEASRTQALAEANAAIQRLIDAGVPA